MLKKLVTFLFGTDHFFYEKIWDILDEPDERR